MNKILELGIIRSVGWITYTAQVWPGNFFLQWCLDKRESSSNRLFSNGRDQLKRGQDIGLCPIYKRHIHESILEANNLPLLLLRKAINSCTKWVFSVIGQYKFSVSSFQVFQVFVCTRPMVKCFTAKSTFMTILEKLSAWWRNRAKNDHWSSD